MEKSGHFPRHCAELAIDLIEGSEPGIECAAFALGFLASAYTEDTADSLSLDTSQDARDRFITAAQKCRNMEQLTRFQESIVSVLRPARRPVH